VAASDDMIVCWKTGCHIILGQKVLRYCWIDKIIMRWFRV
jgi:hypothetical protein